MTAPFRLSPLPSSRPRYGAAGRKNPARNALTHVEASRRWFAGLLWRAFPAPSEAELAARAAPVLGVSERQVRNWLRGEHDASLRYVTAVLALAGVECILGGGR